MFPRRNILSVNLGIPAANYFSLRLQICYHVSKSHRYFFKKGDSLGGTYEYEPVKSNDGFWDEAGSD